MSEITVNAIALTPALQRFVLHWGDLGGQWGVNRSVAQVHALLLVSGRPLNAEEIADTLGLARSNVSTSIKELLGWQLVRRAPILGERRDHFEAEGDVWEMVTRIVEMRKARELDPASQVLKACLAEAKEDPGSSPVAVARLGQLLELLDLLDGWFEQMRKVPRAQLLPLIRLGSKAVDLISPFLRRKDDKRSEDGQ